MQVTETNQDGLKREFKIVIDAKDIETKVESRLDEIAQQVRVPGFRPGKVPPQVMKQRFGDSVIGEILEKAVTDSANQAMAERDMRPAMEPKIEIQDYKVGADLEYTIAVELMPDFEPMDFAKIEIERLTTEVTDSEIDQAMDEIASRQKQNKSLEKPRKSGNGDVVVLDFVGTIDGKEFSGGTAEDHYLELGSNSFIPGFEDQLVGKAAGDDVVVKIAFPEDYGNEELSGKAAEFNVTIKEIRETVQVDIDEEFSQANGFDSLAAMKTTVRETLQGNYDTIARNRVKRVLLDMLAKGHDFDVPEGMVVLEFDIIWEQIEKARKEGQLDPEDAAKSEDEMRAEYRDIAARRVRLGLLLSEVGRRNDIVVSDQEINQAVAAEAQKHPGHEQEVMEIYKKNPVAKDNLRAPIFENKVVDFILELAQISDRKVTPEELVKADEEVEQAKPAGKKSAKKAPSKKKAATAKAPEKAAAAKPPAKKAPKKKA
ncbi:MAG: trigger factor [Alphaproteobacteria bacterium]|nr:trigger factor [Alphaproteobacteria bacterium]